MPDSGVARALFGAIAEKAHERAKESRAKAEKDRDGQIEIWSDVLKNPNASPEQRTAAVTNLNKLYNVKGKDSPFEKIGGFLTHVGGKLQGGQSQSKPMDEKVPGGAQPGQDNPGASRGLTPLNSAPQDPNVNPAQKGIAEKALHKVGKGLETTAGVGIGLVGGMLSNLSGKVDTPSLPPLQPDMYPTAEQTAVSQGKAEALKNKNLHSLDADVHKSDREIGEQDIEYKVAQAQKSQGVTPDSYEGREIDRRMRGLEPKSSGKTDEIKSVDGVPMGVYHQGKVVTPGDEGWTSHDDKLLADAKTAYKQGEKAKDDRIQLAANSRVAAYLKSRLYGVMDASTGSLVMVPASEVANNPGKYAPAGPAVTAKNRTSVFSEIETATGYLEKAINELPDKAFDPSARAQIAMVLRSDSPTSAWHNFLSSDVAATLDDKQIQYVTAVVNMDESAMALRTVAGMGQGSDTMRNAIIKMLPGSSTPSKAYAKEQVRLFKGEVGALKSSIPNIGSPGQGGGSTKQLPSLNGPKVGTIEDGHEYMGGDPADQKNWKKVKK